MLSYHLVQDVLEDRKLVNSALLVRVLIISVLLLLMQQGLNGSMDLIQLLKDLVVHLTVLAVVLPKESLELLHNQKDLRAQDLILVLSDWHACFLR